MLVLKFVPFLFMFLIKICLNASLREQFCTGSRASRRHHFQESISSIVSGMWSDWLDSISMRHSLVAVIINRCQAIHFCQIMSSMSGLIFLT